MILISFLCNLAIELVKYDVEVQIILTVLELVLSTLSTRVKVQ